MQLKVMGLQAAATWSSSKWVASTLKPPQLSLNLNLNLVKLSNATCLPSFKAENHRLFELESVKTRATVDEKDQVDDDSISTPLLVREEQPNREVEESLQVLKRAAKTRKVAAEEILSALSVIEKAKVDPSGFLETLGGSKSPGRTWMLVFTAEKQLKSGRYFPLTAVQRFDAAECQREVARFDKIWNDRFNIKPKDAASIKGKRIENGVYLGPIGRLTFEGRFNWKKKILAFIFERIRIKIGFLKTIEIGLGQKEDREPSSKDPFFIWFYVDEEIAVARGRSGGTAFWCRCRRVTSADSFE